MRLQELGDAEVDHTWMWRLNPHHGAVMEPEEYVDSVRLRLGCAGPCELVPCAACQNGSLDTGAAHATCCTVGEATRGHDAVNAAAQSCDCTAETEVPALIPGTTCDLRMFSPLHWATPTPPSKSRSAHHIHNRLVLTARRPDTKPNSPTVSHTFPPSSARTSPTPRLCGVPMGDLR